MKNLSLILDQDPRVRGRSETLQKRVFANPDKEVRGNQWEICDSFNESADKFCALADVEKHTLRRVGTPFKDESEDPQGCIEVQVNAEHAARSQLAVTACFVI